MYSVDKNCMIYLNGKYIYFDEDEEEKKNVIENYDDTNEEEQKIIETQKQNNDFNLFTYILKFFWMLLTLYTNIELFFKNINKKEVLVEDLKITKNKSNYYYYSNNKIIAESKNLTNRKNYDFAISYYDTNSDNKFVEVILCYNKQKKRNMCICNKHFMSIFYTIDKNDYEIKFDSNNMNFYLTNNIIDYHIISFLMLKQHNINITKLPYNVIMIDHNSNIIELKDTDFIKFYKSRYIIGKYD